MTLNRVRLWLRSVLLRRPLEREMRAEMAEHIERSTDRLEGRGMRRKQARREALREFGNVAYLQEESRLARGTGWLDSLLGDIRFALRHFSRNLLSTATMVLVLSLGIGINVLIFSLVQGYTARPPVGIEASDDLVRIRGSQRGTSERTVRAFSLEEVQAYAALEGHFTAVGGWTSQMVTASGAGTEEITLTATFVTNGYFPVVRVQPILGRAILPDADGAQVALLSHASWTRLYAEDPAVLGRTITLNETPFTIIGVAPPDFHGVALRESLDLQVWLPIASYPRIAGSALGDAELFRAIGRLAPGVGREEAGAAVEVVAARLAARNDLAAEQDPTSDVAPLLVDNDDPGFDSDVRSEPFSARSACSSCWSRA